MAGRHSKYSESVWGPEKDRVMRREWDNLTREALAQRLGCSLNTLRRHAERLNLLAPQRMASYVQQA